MENPLSKEGLIKFFFRLRECFQPIRWIYSTQIQSRVRAYLYLISNFCLCCVYYFNIIFIRILFKKFKKQTILHSFNYCTELNFWMDGHYWVLKNVFSTRYFKPLANTILWKLMNRFFWRFWFCVQNIGSFIYYVHIITATTIVKNFDEKENSDFTMSIEHFKLLSLSRGVHLLYVN